MTFTYTNVTIDALNKNAGKRQKYIRLVTNACGEVKNGELMAIMGPSGCVKTSLLSALAGRMQKGSITSGEILFNNEKRNTRDWLKMTGFVDQDDQIFEKLTVEETLTYTCNFRLSKTSSKDVSIRIDELVKRFGLTDVVRNQMYKLSGGERKRVMIAIELITEPEIIFLDEPTSGLDTKTALVILKLLKELTNKGKYIILTIHHPSVEIFSMFDKILLMSNSRTVYKGPASSFEEFLNQKGLVEREGISFPDFIAEMVVQVIFLMESDTNMKKVDMLINEFKENTPKKTYIQKKENESYINYSLCFSDTFYIAARKLKISRRNMVKTCKPIIIRLLIFTLYLYNIAKFNNMHNEIYQKIKDEVKYDSLGVEIQKYITSVHKDHANLLNIVFILPVSGFTTMLASYSAFFDEHNAIKREIAVGSYTVVSYYLGVFFSMSVVEMLIAVYSCAFLLIFSASSMSICFVIYMFLTIFFGLFVGMAISSITENKKLIAFLGIFFVIMCSIPCTFSHTLQQFFTNHTQKDTYQKYKRLLYLPIFLPGMHWSAFYCYLMGKSAYLKIINNMQYYEYVKPKVFSLSRSLFESSRYFCYGFVLDITSIVLLLFSMMLFYITFAIKRQSQILMPEIRLQLSKK